MHGPRNVGDLNEVDKLEGADELVEQITEVSFIAIIIKYNSFMLSRAPQYSGIKQYLLLIINKKKTLKKYMVGHLLSDKATKDNGQDSLHCRASNIFSASTHVPFQGFFPRVSKPFLQNKY